MKKIIVVIVALLAVAQMWWRTPESRLEEGDIVVRGTGWGVGALTMSKWTHCGILHETNGEWFVIEANQGVEMTPLKKWRRYPYIYKTLRVKGGLSPEDQPVIYGNAKSYIGKRYDKRYCWSDEKLYCSELVWKAYYKDGVKLSEPRTMNTFLLYKVLPKSVKEVIIHKKGLIVDEKMVPPCDIVRSRELRRVW